MTYLDWYLHLSETCQEMGYDLGLLLCPDPEVVINKIIPSAVEIACKTARKQARRMGPRSHWKMYLSDPQLYQIGILEASRAHMGTAGPGKNWLPRYIAFLCLCTLPRNSFYVAVGFGRILSTGSTPEILELFELLSHRFSPDDPPIGRDEKSAHDASSNIHQQIYAEFKDSFQTNGKKLLFDNVPKSAGALNDDICRSLDRVIPWETEHFPATKQARRTSYERMAAEMAIAHVCIDQHRCLEEVKRDNQRISRYFDAWKVPIANSAEPTEPAEKPGLRWNDV